VYSFTALPGLHHQAVVTGNPSLYCFQDVSFPAVCITALEEYSCGHWSPALTSAPLEPRGSTMSQTAGRDVQPCRSLWHRRGDSTYYERSAAPLPPV